MKKIGLNAYVTFAVVSLVLDSEVVYIYFFYLIAQQYPSHILYVVKMPILSSIG